MIQHNKAVEVVFNIIRDGASEANPINLTEILRKMQDTPDNACDRRTVSRALDKLRSIYGKDDEFDEDEEWPDEHIHLHCRKVERSSSDIYKDYWFSYHYEDEDDFTDEELMFLMDAVQFSKHIGQKDAEEITNKLAKLSHNRYSGVFNVFSDINEKNGTYRKDIFMIIGDINRAINQHKMISFHDNEFGTDKKLHRVTDFPVEVSPFRIVVSDGYYYLLCSTRGTSAIKSYRIDKITDVTILDELYVHDAARRKAALHPNEYLIEHRYMNSGEPVNVTLEIVRSVLGEVIDSFGTKITIDPADESSNRLTVHIKSSEKDIIDWAMRYGEYAVVIDPEYIKNEIYERAERIALFYRNDNNDIRYLEMIARAERWHGLRLVDIDLNGQESYKHLEGIRSITLRHNRIRDFSFLSSYTELRDLVISHNELGTPEAISQLSNLRSLTLEMTGIDTLVFLHDLDNLTRLTINEYSLESVAAIYSLRNLKVLTVSKPVSRLIDKRRLRSGIKYIVEDGFAMPFFMRSTLPPEESRHSLINRGLEALGTISTGEVTDASVKETLCSMIYTGSRRFIVRDKQLRLLDECCSAEERTAMYTDLTSFTGGDFTWFVTYEGEPFENEADLDPDKVTAVSLFKRDHGLKLVGMAVRNLADRNRNRDANIFCPTWFAHIKYLMDNNTGWAEISGELESAFWRVCSRENVIDPAILEEHNVFADIEINGDDCHYYRLDESGKKHVKKIAYGHIELG